jgi:hypothetical protein
MRHLHCRRQVHNNKHNNLSNNHPHNKGRLLHHKVKIQIKIPGARKIILHSLTHNKQALHLHKHNLLEDLHKLHKQQILHNLVLDHNKQAHNKVVRLAEVALVS